jgi:toxin FitB
MADGLIAASALVYGMIVVTRNTVDFGDTRLPVINPWQL